MLATLGNLGADFDEAGSCFRASVIVLVVLAAVTFIGSVTQLLRCVIPAPAKAIPDIPLRSVFYLGGNADARTGIATNLPSYEALNERIDGMTPADIKSELASELLKVSAIRARKVAFAGSGLKLLGAEVAIALILLSSLAVDQL